MSIIIVALLFGQSIMSWLEKFDGAIGSDIRTTFQPHFPRRDEGNDEEEEEKEKEKIKTIPLSYSSCAKEDHHKE